MLGCTRTTDSSLLLAPGCNLACPVCDCRAAPADEKVVRRELGRGGGLLELRGEAALALGLGPKGAADDAAAGKLGATIERAKDAGWRDVYVRTNGVAFAAKGRAEALAQAGATGVVFFLSSDRPAVHDAIARVRGAHAAGLAGLRALAQAGLEVRLEVPVLDPSLQDLRATLALALDAAPRLWGVRLYALDVLRPVGGAAAPRELSPVRWDLAKKGLREVIAFMRERGLHFRLTERDGIPLCAVVESRERDDDPLAAELVADRGGKPMPRQRTSSLAPVCSGCSAQRGCPGTTRSYLEKHGSAGLDPATRAAPRRKGASWDETRRQAAREAFFVVLRPTVHCNQDCWFCSANETSGNVEEDPGRMMRRIARLARTGAKQVSFSGGEPTLSRHLVDYVEVARRSGISRVELVTNGVLLDKREKVDALVRAGLTHVFVSLHAHDEALSRLVTRKNGDHARTTRALQHFARHPGVTISVNHVVTAQNYRSLVRFVDWLHEELGARVAVSFAFVTPQYKALERLAERMPRLSEVAPYVKRALARAHELGIEVVVGSRQGIPPCLLDELLPFSDVLASVSGALTEDAPQKEQGPACADCRFGLICTGVWKPYAALHGTAELRPLPGAKITPEEAFAQAEFSRYNEGLGFPEALRYGDGTIPRSDQIALPAAPEPRRHLPVVEGAGEPLRVALVGTGPRALAFVRVIERVPGLSLVGVASPHAPEKELPEIAASVRRARELEGLVREVRPDVVIVASATRSHAELARKAIALGLPCLVEKPLAGTSDEAAELVEAAKGLVTPAHQLRASGGVAELCAELGDRRGDRRPTRIDITHRTSPSSPAGLHSWSRLGFYELFIHLGDVAFALADEPLVVRKASARGGGRPERVTVKARGEGPLSPSVTIGLSFVEPSDGLEIRATLADGRRLSWIRAEGRDVVEVSDEGGARTRTPASGGDLERLLASFRDSVAHGKPPLVPVEAGLWAMRFAVDAVGALSAAGAPLERAAEPLRVASAPLRERLG